MIGTIKKWVAPRGFGFLAVSDHPDVFLHVSAFRRTDDPAPPDVGDVVEFAVVDEARGPRARDARIVKRAAEAARR